jgi:hypothetical protein
MALLNEKSFEDLCANMLKNREVRRDLRSRFGADAATYLKQSNSSDPGLDAATCYFLLELLEERATQRKGYEFTYEDSEDGYGIWIGGYAGVFFVETLEHERVYFGSLKEAKSYVGFSWGL